MSDIRDKTLAPSGRAKIEWARRNMPMMNALADELKQSQLLRGLTVAICIHQEAKSAYLAQVLHGGGANVVACASNPLSTQDDVVAALAESGVEAYAIHGVDEAGYVRHLHQTLDHKPNIVIDDGGDLVDIIHNQRTDLIPNILGGSEETTTGILRLKAMSRMGTLRFPMMAANDARCKYLFDNRYGTGQSVWDGINRTSNLIVAGKTVVVAGYGWCGKGTAMRAKGLGAKVIVCEVDPVCAVEAIMDGFTVMPMNEAAQCGDIFVTVTGCCDVITREHFLSMKDGALLANAGHFDVEVSVAQLEEMCVSKAVARNGIMAYDLPNGRRVNLLAEGRLVNLAAGDGHPCEIMDMSFAVQTLCIKYLLEHRDALEPKLYVVPPEIDDAVARLKLSTLGVGIDTLTEKQRVYLYGE